MPVHLPAGARNITAFDRFETLFNSFSNGFAKPFVICDQNRLRTFIMFGLTKQIQRNPIRIIVYTGDESKMVPTQVMTHGGAAFVSKSEQPAILLETIAAVFAGRMVFPYIDVRTIYDNPLATLTRRELEVLSDLDLGRTNKQIARDLGVSLNTVKFHVRNLFQKLGVNSRSQAISMYLRS